MTYKTAAIAKQMATKKTKQTGAQYAAYEIGPDMWTIDRVVTEQAPKPVKARKQTRSDPVPHKAFDQTPEGRAAILDEVKGYFIDNYEFDGNDIVIECYSDQELQSMIGKSKKLLGAVMQIRFFTGSKEQAEYRSEVKAAGE